MAQGLIAILGPTAAGKTDFAVELLEQFPVELISVDSAQVYRRMNIGSAKPDAETLAVAPHHLIDIREPWETYSASDFVQDATALIDAIHKRGKTPVLVGGTVLYFRALLRGLSPLPGANDKVRAAIESEAKELGWEALHQQLRDVDPDSAARIHPNDPQRIQRALEVFRITGEPLSELQGKAEPAFSGPVEKIVVAPEQRSQLHDKIEIRFETMLEQGLIEETRELLREPQIHAELPAMRAVGYRQVAQYLAGDFDRSELSLRGLYATRQFAKRQFTWLRKEADARWVNTADVAAKKAVVLKIAQFLQ